MCLAQGLQHSDAGEARTRDLKQSTTDNCAPYTACLVNSEDPDKMLHYAAFHLGLHCLLLKTKLIFRERKIHFLGETGDFSINTYALNI